MIRYTHAKKPGYGGFLLVRLYNVLKKGTVIKTREGSFPLGVDMHPGSHPEGFPDWNKEAIKDAPESMHLMISIQGILDAWREMNDIPPLIRPGLMVDGHMILSQEEFEAA